jgi:PAS domain S-box-containing protein/diguanylate cyclase (GGDEF)-like protein
MTISAYPSPGPSTRPPALARAVLAVDPAGAITAWGGSAEAIFGYRPEEVLGRPVGMLLPPTLRDTEMPLRRALDGEVIDGVVTERRAKTGDLVPVCASATPAFAGGKVTGAVGSYTDLRTYERTEAQLRLVLDTTQDAYVAIDAGGRIVDWNPAAELLFGWSREEVLGRLLHETIMPPRMRAAHLRALSQYRAGDTSRIVGRRVELPTLRRDGTEVAVELSVAPLDLGGELVFTAFIRDISERTRSREALEAGRERLLEAQRIAGLGSWEWDLATGEVTVSQELARIFGRPAASTTNAREVLAAVHPDDAEQVRGEARAAIDGGAPFASDFRIVRPDGDVRVLQSRGRIVRDGERAVRMVGTDLDITDRVRGEAATRRLAAVVASTDDAVMTMTSDGVITSWNAAAQRLFGYPSEMAVGQAVGMLVPPERTGEEERIIEQVRCGERVQDRETRRVRRDGRVIDVSLTVSAIREDDGRVVEIAKIVRDISARKVAERELRRHAEDLEALAREDALTGLLTRSEFHGALDQALERGDRLDEMCSIVLLDVDGLSRVNERDGRAAGDGLLRDLARHVRRGCADDHVVCRVGDDEIGIVLPAGTAEQAASLARDLSAGWAGTHPAAGVCAGVATWPREAADKAGLLGRAAAALSRAKSARRTGAPPPPVELPPAGAEAAERILALLRRHLGMEMAYLAEFSEGRQIVRSVDAGTEHPRLAVGTEVALDETYCRRMVDGDLPNSSSTPRWSRSPRRSTRRAKPPSAAT